MQKQLNLNNETIRNLINEIISGEKLFEITHEGEFQALMFRIPLPSIKLRADMHYNNVKMEAINYGLPTKKQMEKRIIEFNLINYPKLNTKLEELEDKEEVCKTKLKFTKHPQQTKELKHDMAILQRLKAKIQHELNKPFEHTAEYKAETARTLYMVVNGVFDLEGNFYWNSVEEFLNDSRSRDVQNRIVAEYVNYASGHDSTTIRAIARNPEWQIYWRSMKSCQSPLFHNPVTDWDVNKLLLTRWSDIYESVMNNPECPTPEIIDNDIELDKWLADRRRMNSNGAGTTVQTTPDGKRITTHNVNQPYKLITQKELAITKGEKK